MRIYLTILLQLVYISCFSANDNTEIGIRKNIFYLEGESILAISNVSLNYERIVLQDQSFRLSIKGGIGFYYFAEVMDFSRQIFVVPEGIIYKINLCFILKSGFEIGLGISYLDCKSDCNDPLYPPKIIHPIITAGWRLQDRPFFFRIHAGSWGLGLSFGYSF